MIKPTKIQRILSVKNTLRKVLHFNWQKRQYSHIHVIDAQFAVEMFAYVTAEPHRLMPERHQLIQTYIITTTIFDYQLKCPMFFSLFVLVKLSGHNMSNKTLKFQTECNILKLQKTQACKPQRVTQICE